MRGEGSSRWRVHPGLGGQQKGTVGPMPAEDLLVALSIGCTPWVSLWNAG